jgi:3-oxoacyl-[acyl-carrier-protein] synthase-3
MKYARITGTGGYLPEKIVTNADLEKTIDTTHEWIVERTGIHRRHIAADNETTGTMSAEAAKKAMSMAGVSPSEIDMIIVGTCTPDQMLPSTACLVQNMLGIRFCPAFDVAAACAGFNYGLSIAQQFIERGMIKHALVIGAETMSRILDWTDRRTCVLFGDGAGAVVLSADQSPGIRSTHIHADGQYKDLLSVKNPREEEAYVQMQGQEVFKIAVNCLGKIVEETLSANQITSSDINWLVPHQANLRIISAVAKKLGMPMEKVILTVDSHSNTSAASVPLALDVAVRDGRIKRGDLLLLESFGGGFTWGSALITY